MKEFRLCYADEKFAYFTNQPIEKQTGEDWHKIIGNSSPPDEYSEWHQRNNLEKWEIKKIAWEGEWHSVKEEYNSPVSAENINKNKLAWLADEYYGDTGKPAIKAGTTYDEFIKIILENGGKVYTELNEVGEMKRLRKQNVLLSETRKLCNDLELIIFNLRSCLSEVHNLRR